MRSFLKFPLVSAASLALGATVLGCNDSSVMHALFGRKKDEPTTKKVFKQTETFIWGNGIYQARPDAPISFKNFEPKLIKTFSGDKNVNLKDVAFGEYHEAGIGVDGNVYIWRKHVIDSAMENKDNERADVQLLDNKKNTKQITFSKGFLWVLKENGEVFQYVINAKIGQTASEQQEVQIIQAPRKIQELKGISQIATGDDHFAALDSNGDLWTMGDDTVGQCGLGSESRSTAPPFYERRVRKPKKLETLGNIQKVVCGGTHTLVLTKEGAVYGFGSNSGLQLSHQEQFASVENPLVAVFEPLRLEKNLESVTATDIAAGEEFSIVVGRNRTSSETEVYGCGRNLQGQLGVGNLSHINEIQKVESLSNYTISTPEGEKHVRVDKISCGRNHCMALLNVGAVMEWGANEHGQLGNRKRVFSENPIIIKTFAQENVLNVSCGEYNSAVIIEHKEKPATPTEQKK